MYLMQNLCRTFIQIKACLEEFLCGSRGRREGRGADSAEGKLNASRGALRGFETQLVVFRGLTISERLCFLRSLGIARHLM